MHNDNVIYSKYSTLILKQKRIDGILTLYPNRMEFKTMQGAFVSAISLLNINRMEEYTRFLFFHTGLKIICNDSTEWNLILNNREYWLRIINNQLLGLHGEGNTQSDNALQHAMNLMNNELYNKAIWEWTCLIKDNQYLETAYLQRGTAYFIMRDFENAKLDCETAISMFPDNPENHVAYFILAHCADLLNATETALYYIEQALLLKPEDPLYYRESCIINYNAKNFELAYKHVLSAIRLGLVDDEVLQYKNYLETILNAPNSSSKENMDTKDSNDRQADFPQMIDLMTCTKDNILTLEGFNEAKALEFIRQREQGKVYYDIETFANDFNLQPHERLMIQERLIFPRKAVPKSGRMIDF